MKKSNANQPIFQSQHTRYYTNNKGIVPRTIRLIRREGDRLIGTYLGREYVVDAADYEETSARTY